MTNEMNEQPEVWCERCPAPTARVVETTSGKHPLCADHAAMLEFQINSSNFNGGGPRIIERTTVRASSEAGARNRVRISLLQRGRTKGLADFRVEARLIQADRRGARYGGTYEVVASEGVTS